MEQFIQYLFSPTTIIPILVNILCLLTLFIGYYRFALSLVLIAVGVLVIGLIEYIPQTNDRLEHIEQILKIKKTDG